LAEGLSVRSLIQSAAHDRDYVVEHEVFRAVTPNAFRIYPVHSLESGEAKAVALLLSRFRFGLVIRKHLVSIDAPSFFEGGSHLGASFRRVLESFRWSCFLTWPRSSSSRLLHTFKNFGTVIFAPKGIVGAAHGNADAFSFAASNHDAALDLRESAINQLSACFARIGLSFFLFGHGYLGKIG
jgi:hypothetical protein